MPKTEAELDRMIERVRNQEGGVMSDKTQGEEIFEEYIHDKYPFSSPHYLANEEQTMRVQCAQATHQERAANALERIADALEEMPRDVINTLDDGA